MRDDDNRKRIVLIWEKSADSNNDAEEAGEHDEATVLAAPLGDRQAPVLRIVSSGFGQTARAIGAGNQPSASLRCAA